ncbi:MAG: HisA/HisF-related TIM barrel protein [Acidobacteriota bacterium]|nr:HisA/HisF-related TIM barrel protein [Acidobacteriota bacterium]
MLIPSIDLKNGRVVQLVQGDRLAIESDDLEGWITRFAHFRKVQLIDLDAAMGSGTNDALVRLVAPRLPCRVGGGIRTLDRAREVLDYGASAVIVSSALFANGQPDLEFARSLAETVGRDRVIAAVDSKDGRVVIRGWRESVAVTAVEAAQALEPFCGEFLYTHVDREGLMRGTDMAAVHAVAAATSRPVTAAGGITTREEIDALDAAGIDAVVGMAIYSGTLALDPAPTRS